MKYTYNNINLKKEPMEFNKNTKKRAFTICYFRPSLHASNND